MGSTLLLSDKADAAYLSSVLFPSTLCILSVFPLILFLST